ncbi:hypothetical protein ARV1_gp14 [Acidianus rod-shaped virus 1]|uniref:Uncharacterized protein n=1 Tax=Acidianus rod-shaped virus 1 TaxID=309181 RepID=Q50I57_9VIRU|nr:hypothetical protein ARV1_gp14 [Acidianus rod-shaped virus 1]CAI44169.1 hypothetical protein [Acidianus rod-shaped virus 1]
MDEDSQIPTCFDILKSNGYNLKGYSQDTILLLQTAHGSFEECETYLFMLEIQYG